MWTQVLATYAAIVSTSSLVVAYLAFRSGGPRLSAVANFEPWASDPVIEVELYNRGRFPVTVVSVVALGEARAGLGMWDLLRNGEERIEGHAGKTLAFPARDVFLGAIEGHFDPTISITRSDGKHLVARKYGRIFGPMAHSQEFVEILRAELAKGATSEDAEDA